MSDIQENLKEVRAEAKTMLETLAAVRGVQYAETVRCLLLCRQLAEITSILALEAKNTKPELAESCVSGATMALMQLASSQRAVGAVSAEDWASMAKDVGLMINNVNGLMRRAVEAGVSGESFGGHA